MSRPLPQEEQNGWLCETLDSRSNLVFAGAGSAPDA